MKNRRTIFYLFCVVGALCLFALCSCAGKKEEIVDVELDLIVDDDIYVGEVRNFSFRNLKGEVFEDVGEDGEVVIIGDTPFQAAEDDSSIYHAVLPAGEYRLYEDGVDTGAFFTVDLKHNKVRIAYCSSLAYASAAIIKSQDTAGIYVIIKDKTFVNLGFDNPLLSAMNQIKSPANIDMSDCPNMTMGFRGFYNSKNLKSFVLSPDMKTLGKESFAFCSSMYRLVIPEGLQTVEGDVFEACTSLTEIEVSSRNKYFASKNGVLTDKTQRSLVAWPSAAGDVVLPETIQLLSDYCFAGCSELSSVVMSGVKTVKPFAFKDCVSLNKVVFSSALELIDKNVFEHCSLLEDIVIDEDDKTYSSSKGQILSYDGTVLYAWPSAKKNIVIPDSVTRIDDCAFQNQTGLIQVTMPRSVREIGYQAFSSCTDLSIVMMSNVAIIESYAFEKCTALKQIDLPANIRRCDGGAFAECSSLSSITVQDGNRTFSASNGAIYSADLKTLVEWPAASGTVTIPETVETIGPYAFNRNYDLKKVVMKNVKSLGHHAFDDCKKLNDITLNEGLASIGSHAFSNCLEMKKIVIPASVTTIKNYAFWFWNSEQTIACRASSVPAGWDFAWDADCDAKVVMSYSE
ncbi:MAG: leucine-rich repeat domain-containing protein [Treponema sp.]|nr:leucine-rich repeat domain-containing protein [Treponema sp.]